MTGSVVVTPLQPPFRGRVMFFRFRSGEHVLALSLRDGGRVVELLGGAPEGREIAVEAVGETKIRVSVCQ
jgi:hypothetical protein